MKQNKPISCNSEDCRTVIKELQKELGKLTLWLYLSALLAQLDNPDRKPKTPVQRKVNEILKETLSKPTRTH